MQIIFLGICRLHLLRFRIKRMHGGTDDRKESDRRGCTRLSGVAALLQYRVGIILMLFLSGFLFVIYSILISQIDDLGKINLLQRKR